MNEGKVVLNSVRVCVWWGWQITTENKLVVVYSEKHQIPWNKMVYTRNEQITKINGVYIEVEAR